jgi:hypothetical protein
VNVITWNRAYCLFPSASLIKKASYVVTWLHDRSAAHLADLTEEGIKTKLTVWNQRKRPTTTEAITCPPRVGDKHTFVVELDTEGINTPATTTEQQNAGRDAIALQSIKFHLQKKKAYPYAENNEVSVQQYELSYDIMHFSTSAYLCRPWWVQ